MNATRRSVLLGSTSGLVVGLAMVSSSEAEAATMRQLTTSLVTAAATIGMAGAAVTLAAPVVATLGLTGLAAGAAYTGAAIVGGLLGYGASLPANAMLNDFFDSMPNIESAFDSIGANQQPGLRTMASVGTPSPSLAGSLFNNFGEIPGGVVITHDPSKSFPQVTSMVYHEKKNILLLNDRVGYRPRLPAPLVHLVWQKLEDKGLPGCTLSWTEAITFGGFDPDDPIGTMIIAADEVTYNIQSPYDHFEKHYDLPPGAPRRFSDDSIWDRATCFTDFRNLGFEVVGAELISTGISIDTYWMAVKLQNGKLLPASDGRSAMADPDIRRRAEFLHSTFEQWKDDVAIDFVIRLTELIAFIKEVRAQGLARKLPEGVYSVM